MTFEIAVLNNLITLGIAVIIQCVTIAQTNKTLRKQGEQAELDRVERTKEARLARDETQRIEWKNYLIERMQQLIEARAEYEEFLGTNRQDTERHARIVGKAIAVCLAVNDDFMTKYANEKLTPYFADEQTPDGPVDWASRNRNTMQEVVQHLAKIIKAS